jgi:DNA-binding Xre family transcriptional regulator
LNEDQVIELKKTLLDPNRKIRLKVLAKQYGVSEMQLHRIKTGQNWGHIKVEVPGATES